MADQKKQPAPKKSVVSIASLISKKKSEKSEAESVSLASKSISSEIDAVNNRIEEIRQNKQVQSVQFKSARDARVKRLQNRPALFNLYRTDLTLLKKMYPVIDLLLKKLEYDIKMPEDEATALIKKIYDDVQEMKKGSERSLYSLDSQLVQLEEKIEGITTDIISKQRNIRKQFESDLEQLYVRQSLDLQEIQLDLSMEEAFDEKEDLDLSSSDTKVDARIEEIKKRTEIARIELEQASNKASRELDEELQKKIKPLQEEQKNIDGSIQFVAMKYVEKWEIELNRIVTLLNPSYVPSYNKENLSQEFYKTLSDRRFGVTDKELSIITKAMGEKRKFTAEEKVELSRLIGSQPDKLVQLELVHIPKLSVDYFEKALARAKVSLKAEKELKEQEKEEKKSEEKIVRRIAVKARTGDEDEVDNQIDYEDEDDEDGEQIVEVDFNLNDDVAAQVEQEASIAADQKLNSIYQQEEQQDEEEEQAESKEEDNLDEFLSKFEDKQDSGEKDVVKDGLSKNRKKKALLQALDEHQEEINNDDTTLEEIEHELDDEEVEDRYDSEDDEVDVHDEFDRFQPRRRFARYTRSESADERYMTPEEKFLAGGYIVKSIPSRVQLVLEKEMDTLRHEANTLDICYRKVKEDPVTKRIIADAKQSIDEAIAAKNYASYTDFIVRMLLTAREDKPYSLSESIHSIQLIDDQRILLHHYLESANELDLTVAISKALESMEIPIPTIPILQPYAYGKLRESLKGRTTRLMIEELNEKNNEGVYKEFITEFFEPNVELIPYLITRQCFMYLSGFSPEEFRKMAPFLTIEQYVLIKEYTKKFPDRTKEIAATIYAMQSGQNLSIDTTLSKTVASLYVGFKAMPIHERLLKGIPLYDKINLRVASNLVSQINQSNRVCKDIEDNSSYSVSLDTQKIFPYVPTLLLTKLREVYPTVSGHRTKHLLHRLLSCESMTNDQYLFIKFFMHDPSTKDKFNEILETFHHVAMWVERFQSSKMTFPQLLTTLREWYQPTAEMDRAESMMKKICFVLDSIYTKEFASVYQEIQRIPLKPQQRLPLVERLTRYETLYREKVPKEFSDYFNSSEVTFLYDVRVMFLSNYRALNLPVFGTIYDLINIEKTVSYFMNNTDVMIDITSIKRKVVEHYQESESKVGAEEMNQDFQFDMAYCILEHNLKSIIKASESIISHFVEIEISQSLYETMDLPNQMTVKDFRQYFFERESYFRSWLSRYINGYKESRPDSIYERFPVFRGSKELKDDDIISSPTVLLEIQTDLEKEKIKLFGLITKVTVYDLSSSKPKLDELVGNDQSNYSKVSKQANDLFDSIYRRVSLSDFSSVYQQLCTSISAPFHQLKNISTNNTARSSMYVAARESLNSLIQLNDFDPPSKQSLKKTMFAATVLKNYRLAMKKRSKMLATMVMPFAFTSRQQFSTSLIEQELQNISKYDLAKVYQENPKTAIQLMESACDLIFQRFLNLLREDLEQLDRIKRDIEEQEEEESLVEEISIRSDLTVDQFVELYKSNPDEFRLKSVPKSMRRIVFYNIFSKKSLMDYLEIYRGMVKAYFPDNFKKVDIPVIRAVIPTFETIMERIRHYLPTSSTRPDENAHRSIVSGRFSIDAFPSLMDAIKNLRIMAPILNRDSVKKYIDLSTFYTQPESEEEKVVVEEPEILDEEQPEILEEEDEKPAKKVIKKIGYEDWFKPNLLFVQLLTQGVLQVSGNQLMVDNLAFTLGTFNPSEQLVQRLSKKDVESLIRVVEKRVTHSISGQLVVIPDRVDPRFVQPCTTPAWYEPNFQPIQNYTELEKFRENIEDIKGIENSISEAKVEQQSIMPSQDELEAFTNTKKELERARERLAFMKEYLDTFPTEEMDKQKQLTETLQEKYQEMKDVEGRLDRLMSIQKNLRVYQESRKNFIGKLPKNIFAQIDYLTDEIKRIQNELTLLNLLRENQPNQFNLDNYNILSARLSRLEHQKRTIEEYVPDEPSFIPYYEELMTLLRKETGYEDREKVTKLRRIETEINSLENERKEVGYELFAIHKQESLRRLHTEFQLLSQNWMVPTKFFLSQVNRYLFTQDNRLIEDKTVEIDKNDLSSAVYRHYSNQISIGPSTIVPINSYSVNVKKLMIGGIGYTLGIIERGQLEILSPQLFVDRVRARYVKLSSKQEDMLDYFQPSSSVSSSSRDYTNPAFSGRSSVKAMLCDLCKKKIADQPFMFTFNLKQNELVTLCSEECSEKYNPSD